MVFLMGVTLFMSHQTQTKHNQNTLWCLQLCLVYPMVHKGWKANERVKHTKHSKNDIYT
ncbi:hypothetical protein BMETH_1448_0 [methanotrophic bacterial endosymbiont of Bathymodiolus sp.]|nr:hypothetical protein BMETH_1448_0 [methanotrophic bacterial endosymbiont of Bathymodiolus sp.]